MEYKRVGKGGGGVYVKSGTGPEHPRKTLRTPQNTPEHPPDWQDFTGTPVITKIRLKKYKTKTIFFFKYWFLVAHSRVIWPQNWGGPPQEWRRKN